MSVQIKTSSLKIKDENGNYKDGLQGMTLPTDPTLTIEGAPADAKATGDAIGEVKLKQGMIEVLENSYDFTELPLLEKKLAPKVNQSFDYENKILYGNNHFINNKEGYTRTSPLYGIEFSNVDNRITKIKGTSTSNSIISFFKYNDNYDIPLEEIGLEVGDSMKMFCYCSGTIPSSSLGIRINCMNGDTTLSSNQIFPSIGIKGDKWFSIPEGTRTIQMMFFVRSGYEVNGLFLPVLVKTSDIEEVITDEIILDSSVNNISIYPCSGNLIYDKNLQEYIDEHTGVTPDDLYGFLTYVTPEQFGAIGDYYTDDTQAIKDCISFAKEKMMPIKMLKSYNISSPIEIDYDDADIEINRLKYLGNDSAIILNCTGCTLKANYLNAGFIAVKLVGDRVRCRYNKVDVGTIVSNHHGIVMHALSKSVYQNEIYFRWIYGGNNEGDYGITSALFENSSFVTENNIYGGHINRVDWAWYGEGGTTKFYSIHCEGSVNGGFYFPSDYNCIIFGDRHAEAERDGNKPFLKLGSGIIPDSHSGHGNAMVRYISSTHIHIDQIDVSENATSYELNGEILPLNSRAMGYIDCGIVAGFYEIGSNISNGNLLSRGAYIWGKKIILQPIQKRVKQVTESILDLRANDKDLQTLPTTFNIDTPSTEIYLHASYCFMGYNEFTVIQTETNKATIYDCDGNLVFDGTTQNAGKYTITHEITADDGVALYDGTGTDWFVEYTHS